MPELPLGPPASSHSLTDPSADQGPRRRIPSLRRLARDPGIAGALFLGMLMTLWVLVRLDGYPLADAVEYVDRADEFFRGEPLDPNTLRGFAMSALFLPAIWMLDALGFQDPRLPMAFARLVQWLFAAGTVLLVARTALRIAGPVAARGAALLAATNPVWAEYAVQPVAGVPAMFFLALGTDLLSGVPRWSRALGAGAALGASILFAYQTLPVAGAIGLVGALRRPWRRWPAVAVLLGASVPLLAQASFDRVQIGEFGSSLRSYLGANAGGIATGLLFKLGFEDAARKMYTRIWSLQHTDDTELYTPGGSYFTELPFECLVWPTLALVLVGIAVAFRRRSHWGIALFVIAALYIAVLSNKDSKSFRLWLPILPALSVLGGLGAASLWSQFDNSALSKRRWLMGSWIAATLLLALVSIAQRNLSKHGVYWQGTDLLVDALAPGQKYAADYHWAVRFRGHPEIELVKLPHGLPRWERLSREHKDEIIDAMKGLDGLLVHYWSLAQDPELLHVANSLFHVHEVLDRRPDMEELEPLHVLLRRQGKPEERTFHRHIEASMPGLGDLRSYVAQLSHPVEFEFRAQHPELASQAVELLGWNAAFPFAHTRQAWITLHWLALTDMDGIEYELRDRWRDGEGRRWDNDHRGARGAVPTTEWKQGDVIVESYVTRWPLEQGFGATHERTVDQAELAIAIYATDGPTPREMRLWRVGIRDPERAAKFDAAQLVWRGDNTLPVGWVRLPNRESSR